MNTNIPGVTIRPKNIATPSSGWYHTAPSSGAIRSTLSRQDLRQIVADMVD